MNEMIRSITAAGAMALLLGTQAAVNTTRTATQDHTRLESKPAWGQLCKGIKPSTDEYQVWLDPMTVRACNYMESPRSDDGRRGQSSSQPDAKNR